jgi:hypothetical protein
LIYARGIIEQAGAVANKRQQFWALSSDWYWFLGFEEGKKKKKASKKRKRALFECEADEARID